MDPIARTAELTAAGRARESRRADRLFDDPYAELLAGEDGLALLHDMPPGAASTRSLAIRTRFFDDWLSEVTRQGIRQIVLVAAGMDSRAYRLDWPERVSVWELDRRELLATKRRLLDEVGARPACHRHEVEVDLEGDRWPDLLRHAGFLHEVPTAWLAEGLLVYLERGHVERLLRHMRAFSAMGSRLGADFVSESFLNSEWMKSYLGWLEERGASWRFGTDRPQDFLAACGWRAEAVRQPGGDGAGAGLVSWFLVTAVTA